MIRTGARAILALSPGRFSRVQLGVGRCQEEHHAQEVTLLRCQHHVEMSQAGLRLTGLWFSWQTGSARSWPVTAQLPTGLAAAGKVRGPRGQPSGAGTQSQAQSRHWVMVRARLAPGAGALAQAGM